MNAQATNSQSLQIILKNLLQLTLFFGLYYIFLFILPANRNTSVLWPVPRLRLRAASTRISLAWYCLLGSFYSACHYFSIYNYI